MALLEVDKLSVRFGGVNAVADVSLSIATGEIHGIIGPNGAGKTSLINAATGMVPVQSGSIRFAGREIVGRAPHTISGYGLGRTFQHVELFGDRTVLENVLTGFYRHQSYGLLAAALRVGKPLKWRNVRASRRVRCLAHSILLVLPTHVPDICRLEFRNASTSLARLRPSPGFSSSTNRFPG